MLDALLPGGSIGTVSGNGTGVAPTEDRGRAPLPACPPWLTPVRSLVVAHRIGPRTATAAKSGTGSSAARAEGKRFEHRVLASLAERFPFISVEPGFSFRDAFGTRSCYPDALLRFNDCTVIVEIKHRGHQLGDAWWQLERYYRPVVEAVFPADPVRSLAIVRGVDPAVKVPGAELLNWDFFSAWRTSPTAGFGVMSWT